VENVVVDPSYLDKLCDFLGKARTSLDTAFGSPRSTAGGYPDKLLDSHGVTARAGANAIMSTLDGSRQAVQTHLNDCLKACNDALQEAKKMYVATDQAQSDILSKQMNVGR
jgi:hypothetical protein